MPNVNVRNASDNPVPDADGFLIAPRAIRSVDPDRSHNAALIARGIFRVQGPGGPTPPPPAQPRYVVVDEANAQVGEVIAWTGTGWDTVAGGGSGVADGKVLWGNGAPSNSLGSNGDTYLDTAAGGLAYGPKAAGAWPAGVAFGQDGKTVVGNGAPGVSQGRNGDSYIDKAATPPRLYDAKTGGAWPGTYVELGSAGGGSSVTYPDTTAATVVPRPSVIDARDYGVTADGTTDDTAALQAALNAAKQTAYSATFGQSGNDIVGTIVELPFGRIKINGVTIPSNVWLRGKGPSSTYLSLASTTAFALSKQAGAVQVTISDLAIVQSASDPTAGGGIALQGGAGASILGDSRDVVKDVVIVGTYWGIKGLGTNESRLERCAIYRTLHRGIDVDGSTDGFISNCTVAQCDGDISFNVTGANTRMWGCKAFGPGAAGTQQVHFSIAGAGRHQVACCESQDAGNRGFDIGGNDVSVLTSCTVDSCQFAAFNLGFADGMVRMIACSVVARGGGAFVPTGALQIQSGTGCTIDLHIKGSIRAFTDQSSNYDGNDITINQGGRHGHQRVAYAAAITPDPYLGATVAVGTLTGDLTVAAPAGTWSTPGQNKWPFGQRLALVLTQDETGGRTVTFNAIFKTSGAIATTASSTTRVEFEWDGTNWREVSRSTT